MANYCENTLRVHVEGGQEKELKDFAEKVGDKLDFNAVVPMPEGYDKDGKWYDWCIKNWGCKWSPYDDSVSIDTDMESYFEASFDTPWSPPVEWIKAVSKIYPHLSLKLSYREDGVGFVGVAKAENGEVEDKTIEY